MAIKPQSNKIGQLRKDAISVLGAVVLAMAFMGPATSVFFNTQPAASGAGYALPFALLLAIVVAALVASAIGAFAQKIPTAGFAYTFNTHGFGKRGGFLSGWILVFAYAMVGPMLLAAIGELTAQFFQTQWNLAIPWWAITIIFAVIVWGIGVLGVSRSATTALIFLALEVGVMLALFGTILGKGGAQGISLAPFNPANASGGISGLGIGMLWGIMFFVGFESAGTLGEETQNARRSIPIALFTAVGIIGTFYVLSSWAATLGFGQSHMNAFVADGTPWMTLTQKFWGSGLIWLVSLTVLSSIFANLVSGINATVRVLFAMGREGILPRSLSQTTVHGNPVVAHSAYMLLALVLALLGGLLWTPLGAYGFFGSILGLGIVITYILINLALISFYWRKYREEFSIVRHGILPVLASLIMLLPIYGQLWPIPAYPNNLVPYLMLLWIACGVIYLVFIARRRPELLDAMGRAMSEEAAPVEEHTKVTAS
ncbi:APC family permease [Ktedonosporobacter rubrisoli]|uniref:APC family permease n=1 Tax=Ktedonosporobacter rubrisoli TaxID=2509675 RepID=A0A4P6JL17_KTERU|nr:APC family permease [Ktedonosporobacter rubrisoli]QBD75864.1 APC family permease [Ktedonosporobacter rubrisoli]